jgi:hypothetical protein
VVAAWAAPARVAPVRRAWDIDTLWRSFDGTTKTASAGVLVVGVLMLAPVTLGTPREHDLLWSVAHVLRDYKEEGYLLATTEAGLLPLYSEWRAIDTWGLNDQWIAHNGRITEGYLQERDPDVIVIHTHFSPLSPEPVVAELGLEWVDMTLTLKQFSERTGKDLAVLWARNFNEAWYVYVRSDLPHAEELARRLRGLETPGLLDLTGLES